MCAIVHQQAECACVEHTTSASVVVVVVAFVAAAAALSVGQSNSSSRIVGAATRASLTQRIHFLPDL